MNTGDLTYIDADGKRRGYCGFNDVRRRHDGEYFCSFCGRELGADFGELVRLSLPPPYSKRLAAQCGYSNTATVDGVQK